jgi:Holliday junction resolvase
MGRPSRDKGLRVEQALVNLHRDLGIHAERVPLSGASRYQGNGADLDVYAFGRDAGPLVAEVKARASGEGFATLERWLGENDALFLRRDRAEPIVVLPWRSWARLLAATVRNPLQRPLVSVPASGLEPSSPDLPARPTPSPRAVLADDGETVRLVIFDNGSALAEALLDPARAVGLAGELIEAAHRRLAQ